MSAAPDHAEPCPAAEQSSSAAAHLRRGTELLKAGDLADAERELRAAIELDPKCAGAWVNLGGILLGRWEFAACVEANRRAAAADPALALAHYNEGIAQLYLGDAEAAVDCLTRATELKPKNGAAFYHLGIALESLGRSIEAKLCVAYATELGYWPSAASRDALQRVTASAQEGASTDPQAASTAATQKENSNGPASSR